eukprot:3940936-Rhodomonas_salina.2
MVLRVGYAVRGTEMRIGGKRLRTLRISYRVGQIRTLGGQEGRVGPYGALGTLALGFVGLELRPRCAPSNPQYPPVPSAIRQLSTAHGVAAYTA